MASSLNPIPIGDADIQVDAYRSTGVSSTKCIYYEIEDIQNYLTNNWPNIIAYQPAPPTDYHWVLGFYPKLAADGHLNFYFVPALVNANLGSDDPARVLDLFDRNNDNAYDREAKTPTGEPNLVFNDGSLWP